MTQQQSSSTLQKVILLVEDDLSNAEVIELLLKAEGEYRVVRFSCGKDILKHLDDIQTLKPVLLLLDYHLPGMSGMDIYKHLTCAEGIEQIPAIFVTARKLSEKEEDSIKECNFLKLIYKPYDIIELLEAIKQTAKQDV
jgi:CheY-like chemotaxis protein